MSKFKEHCSRCIHSYNRYVGDSFDRGKEWKCTHPSFKKHKIIDAYRDEKERDPEIPKWCPLPDIE